MLLFYVFIVLLILFVVFVALENRTLLKCNRELADKNANLTKKVSNYKEWISTLAKMEPFESYSEIQKADLNEQEIEQK